MGHVAKHLVPAQHGGGSVERGLIGDDRKALDGIAPARLRQSGARGRDRFRGSPARPYRRPARPKASPHPGRRGSAAPAPDRPAPDADSESPSRSSGPSGNSGRRTARRTTVPARSANQGQCGLTPSRAGGRAPDKGAGWQRRARGGRGRVGAGSMHGPGFHARSQSRFRAGAHRDLPAIAHLVQQGAQLIRLVAQKRHCGPTRPPARSAPAATARPPSR